MIRKAKECSQLRWILRLKTHTRFCGGAACANNEPGRNQEQLLLGLTGKIRKASDTKLGQAMVRHLKLTSGFALSNGFVESVAKGKIRLLLSALQELLDLPSAWTL